MLGHSHELGKIDTSRMSIPKQLATLGSRLRFSIFLAVSKNTVEKCSLNLPSLPMLHVNNLETVLTKYSVQSFGMELSQTEIARLHFDIPSNITNTLGECFNGFIYRKVDGAS